MRISLEDWLAELIALGGDGNVGFAHQLFASPSDACRDGFTYAMQSRSNVSEDQNMKEEESAGNDLAFSKRFLGSIAALLCNVFNARGSTVVVMVKLMQRAEVSSKTQRKLAGILDNILTRSRLCNTAEALCGWAHAWHLNVVCIFIYHPVWWKSNWRNVSISAVHSDFIQYFSCSEILGKSVRWHEALVAALQRGL